MNRFIKDLIDIAAHHVDELELLEFYTDMIESMVNADIAITEDYLKLNEVFENAFEASGHRLDEEQPEQYTIPY